MTHVDGAPTVWDCCGAWECVCGVPSGVPSDLPVGSCGDTAPTGDPVTRARATLTTDQYLYTSHAHLELVCLAVKDGRQWEIDRAIDAAKRHLHNHKDLS